MIREIVLLVYVVAFLIWLARDRKVKSNVTALRSVDAVIPAFNEEDCIDQIVEDLVRNRYVRRVICVNDGSTDSTSLVLARLKVKHAERLYVVEQVNAGKGSALMNGLQHVETPFVFLTDSDIRVPDDDGIGNLIAHLENGADAVGGIPASDLSGGGLLPMLRASVKAPMIIMKRSAQQIVGGAPFLISGSCGLFRTKALLEVGFSDRTMVEDLDLTWTMVERGYKIVQSARCVVFAQECDSPTEEWIRWKRWVTGFAVCMRLHPRLIFSRFGIGTILPMVFLGLFGMTLFYIIPTTLAISSNEGYFPWWLYASLTWSGVVMLISIYSAKIQKRPSLVLYAPFSVLVLLMVLSVWLRYGVMGLITGKEPKRVKPKRMAKNEMVERD